MKRLISLLITLLLTISFSSYSITCLAANGSVSINGAEAKAGSEVVVTFVATDVKSTMGGALQITSLPKGVELVSGKWTIDEAEIDNFMVNKMMGVFAFAETQNVKNGTIFELKLKLNADAESGAINAKIRFSNDKGAYESDFVEITGKLVVKSDSGTTNTDAPDKDNEQTPDTQPDQTTGTDMPNTDVTDTTNKDDTAQDNQTPDTDDKNDSNTQDANTENIENSDDDNDEDEKGDSPILIALIIITGVALIAAVILVVTKNNAKNKTK